MTLLKQMLQMSTTATVISTDKRLTLLLRYLHVMAKVFSLGYLKKKPKTGARHCLNNTLAFILYLYVSFKFKAKLNPQCCNENREQIQFPVSCTSWGIQRPHPTTRPPL